MPRRKPPPGAALPKLVAGIDYALPGSLAFRLMPCGKSNCSCKADPPKLHGPYARWTRTVAGRTLTRTLNAEQAARYQPWFDNAIRLRALLADLEARSLAAIDEADGWPASK